MGKWASRKAMLMLPVSGLMKIPFSELWVMGDRNVPDKHLYVRQSAVIKTNFVTSVGDPLIAHTPLKLMREGPKSELSWALRDAHLLCSVGRSQVHLSVFYHRTDIGKLSKALWIHMHMCLSSPLCSFSCLNVSPDRIQHALLKVWWTNPFDLSFGFQVFTGKSQHRI